MRIVLFASAYAPAVGGVEELTKRLADQLTAAGDTVEVWTNRHPAALMARESIDGISVRRFPLPLPRMSLPGLAYVTVAAPWALLRLWRAAKDARPDVVHVQCFSANGIYATALAASLRVPLIVTLQGETVMDDHDIFEHSLTLRTGLRIALRAATVVTACSQFVLEDAERRFGLPAGTGIVVPNGVDSAPREIQVPLNLPFDRFVFGVGRMVEKKGFDLLVSAYAQVAATHPDVGLLIGGDGSARTSLAVQIGELGLRDRVVLPGTLSRGQVAWAMANASVFVLPSRVEPFGIVVLEALRAGQPPIVSNHGGASEIVRDGEEGFLVDPLDADKMARAILRVLNDDAVRQRLTSAATARAAAFYWDAIAARYREIYRSVCGDQADEERTERR